MLKALGEALVRLERRLDELERVGLKFFLERLGVCESYVERAYSSHLGLCARREWPRHRRAAEQRDEVAPFYLIELHSVPVQSGAALQITQMSRGQTRWRNDFATLSAAGTQPAYGRDESWMTAFRRPAVMTPMRRARLSPALDQACRSLQ
jgi:hypothetical protein